MKVNFKKLNEKAVVPTKAHHTDAGFDLVATSRVFDEKGNIVYGIGIAVEIPEGYAGLVFPRSSIANYDLALTNAVGLIDSGYHGEVFCKFRPTLTQPRIYNVGERIAQLVIVPYPQIEFTQVEELSDSDRGNGGFGSTGK